VHTQDHGAPKQRNQDYERACVEGVQALADQLLQALQGTQLPAFARALRHMPGALPRPQHAASPRQTGAVELRHDLSCAVQALQVKVAPHAVHHLYTYDVRCIIQLAMPPFQHRIWR
jgi:hypothetical protein